MAEAVGDAGGSVLQVGTVVGAAIGSYARAFTHLLPMVVVMMAPGILGKFFEGHEGQGLAITLALDLGSSLVLCVMTIPACLVADAVLQKQPPLSLGEAFERSGPGLWRFVGWSLAVAAATSGIMLVGIGGAVVALASIRGAWSVVSLAIGALVAAAAAILLFRLVVLWSLLGPVVAFEPAREVGRPLSRSAQLVRPQFWSVVGSWAALWVFSVPGLVLAYVGNASHTPQATAAYWLGTACSVLSAPIMWIGMVAIYRGLRSAGGAGA